MRFRYDGTPALRQSCGNRLRAVRRWYRAASQRTLAEASGISRSALCRYENGLALPQPLHLGRLAFTLHTSVEFLLIGENPRAGRTSRPCGCTSGWTGSPFPRRRARSG